MGELEGTARRAGLPGRALHHYGINMGMCFPIILALMPDIFPDRLRPKGISLCFFAIDLGFILSPFFLGYGGQIFGLANILSITGILGLLGGVLLFFAWRREPRKEQGSGLA